MKEIFGDALTLAPENRVSFLDKVCAGDKSLRREVESLLASSANDSGFMEQAAIGKVAEMFGDTENNMQTGGHFNHYEIIKQIGAGGMGEVYLAKDEKLDRLVAVKILNEKFAQHESNLQRFTREAKAASALNHPNILVIHEIGECENTHFIVSEYVEGVTLREIIQKSPMKISEVLDISIQTANALTVAHTARIVHRDIKPENIMVRSDGYVKILDFGLAKLVAQKAIGLEESTIQQNETAQGMIMGTVNYMSPEQAKGERIDERTDIFSLGAVIYEMVAGRTPFAANSMSETFANLINAEPSPLDSFAPQVPAELQRIISQTLRKDKSARYQSVKDLLADLKSLEKRLEISASFEDREDSADKEQTQILNQASAEVNLPQNSIAVLPFDNMSADAENEYFCDGLAEELLSALSKLKNLKVAARTSAFSFKGKNLEISEIGRKLNVQKIVEGSVRKIGNRLRISVELINVADGYQLWSERYTLEMKDIFEVQDEITLSVVDALKVKLQSGDKAELLNRYAENVEAYEYLLKGNYNLVKRNLVDSPELNIAIEMYKKAVEIDPNYALAHARLGYCYVWKAVYNDAENPQWIKLAESQLEIAESINPELPQIYEARSQIFWSKYRDFDISAAVRGIMYLRQSYPRAGAYEMGVFAFHSGIENVTIRELKLAKELDPSDDMLKFTIVDAYSLFGIYDEAIEIGKPYGANANGYIRALLGANRIAEAEAALTEALANAPNNPRRLGEKVLLLARQGKFAEVDELIPQIRKKITVSQAYHHATYDFACACALNSKAAESVKWLRETYDTGMPIYTVFERDPNLDSIRQTPEFIEFIRDIKPSWENLRRVFDAFS
ncbi:MAG: protein kinase domain-containing protein [Pyrinomonadaceae bacterium]